MLVIIGLWQFNEPEIFNERRCVFMSDSLCVGIDVSSRSNQICILTPDGTKLSSCSLANSQTGTVELSRKIIASMFESGVNRVKIGMESTSIYANGLVQTLSQDSSLSSVDKSIFVFNPNQINKFKKIYNDLPKTDNVDAWLIANYLRSGLHESREVYMDERYEALRHLTRARFHTVQELSREKNRYLRHLFLRFSSLAQENPLSNTFGATSIALIEDFSSVDELAYMPLEQLSAFLKKKGKGKFSDPDSLATDIQKAARSSYRLPKTVENSVNQVIAISLLSIRTYQEQLKQFDEAIENLMATIPNTLNSIKGVGPVYAAGIIAEIGDIHRFKDQTSLAKFAGLCWTKYQSGSYEAANTRMINSGNKYLKYYLLEATNSVRMHDPEIKRFYQLKYKETPKTPHKRALALTARKFVRLVFALLRDNRLYIPPRG